MSKWTAKRIREAKGKQKLACITAYDYSSGRISDVAGIELVLVGDSLAMTVLGYETTLPVTVEEMLHHTAAVVRGVDEALVVADLPFMSYQASIDEGIANAGRFIKAAGADAVKIEGGAIRVDLVKALVTNGMPVLGHIGLTPQSIREMGGYKVQGQEPGQARVLLEDAKALAEAGVFGVVLEGMPAELAEKITAAIPVPTIGIGAGPACDGQILVAHDLLGLYEGRSPKFVKKYADIGHQMKQALESYRHDVESGEFPGPEHCY